jgi:vacuolar-type H+-ATPase subunit I/STV1
MIYLFSLLLSISTFVSAADNSPSKISIQQSVERSAFIKRLAHDYGITLQDIKNKRAIAEKLGIVKDFDKIFSEASVVLQQIEDVISTGAIEETAVQSQQSKITELKTLENLQYVRDLIHTIKSKMNEVDSDDSKAHELPDVMKERSESLRPISVPSSSVLRPQGRAKEKAVVTCQPINWSEKEPRTARVRPKKDDSDSFENNE